MDNDNSDCLRFYDPDNQRLVYVDKGVGKDFWEDLWQSHNLEALRRNPPKHRWIVGMTRRFVPAGGSVLEGGSGLGHKVRSLHHAGFDTTGVDYTERTLEWAREAWKPAKFVQGDVRALPFDDNSFDAYWSFGVIEHFYDGYADILSEMYRVLKPGGHMLCTFPAMTGIRKAKVARQDFELWQETDEHRDNFYQFALNPDAVRADFEKLGFSTVLQRGLGTLSGWPKESPLVKKVTDQVRKLPFGLISKFNVIMDPLMGQRFGHSVLLVLRKP